MNSKNSKTSELHRLILNLTDKVNLKRSVKYVALSNLSIYFRWKGIKRSCRNNRFNISTPTWSEYIIKRNSLIILQQEYMLAE